MNGRGRLCIRPSAPAGFGYGAAVLLRRCRPVICGLRNTLAFKKNVIWAVLQRKTAHIIFQNDRWGASIFNGIVPPRRKILSLYTWQPAGRRLTFLVEQTKILIQNSRKFMPLAECSTSQKEQSKGAERHETRCKTGYAASRKGWFGDAIWPVLQSETGHFGLKPYAVKITANRRKDGVLSPRL